MKVKKKLEDGTEIEVEEPEPGKTTPPDPGAGGSKGGKTEPPAGYVTEESYQGIQRVVAKRDKEITDLKARLEELATQVEEHKTSTGTLSKAKSDLEGAVSAAQTQLQTLQAERDRLNKQLEQQGIIMSDFPDLAALSSFIPPADTVDGFKENAKKFQEALKKHIDAGVQKTLAGATPPGPGTTKGTTGEGEEDKLWKAVYSTAGIPGKEAEYAEANRKLQEFLHSKTGQ